MSPIHDFQFIVSSFYRWTFWHIFFETLRHPRNYKTFLEFNHGFSTVYEIQDKSDHPVYVQRYRYWKSTVLFLHWACKLSSNLQRTFRRILGLIQGILAKANSKSSLKLVFRDWQTSCAGLALRLNQQQITCVYFHLYQLLNFIKHITK